MNTRSQIHKIPVANGKVKKTSKKESFDAEAKYLKLQKQFNDLERTVHQNIVLIWNLVVECKSDLYFEMIQARFDAVYKFLDQVIGAENYSKDCIDYCNWLDSKKKNTLEVRMSSKIIYEVQKNKEKMDKIKGKDNGKIRFERKKTTIQRESDEVATEIRLRLIDYLYHLHGCDKSKTPNVFSNNGKIRMGKKGEIFTVQQIKETYPLELKKPLNECVNCFGRNFDTNGVESTKGNGKNGDGVAE